MRSSNFHTHTTYCDGKDSPEELVIAAVENGCRAIGFSGHSYTGIDDDSPFCMTKEGTEEYKKDLQRLKEKYKDKIAVYTGIEQDYYSAHPADGYDYVIGSVHYILKDGVYLSVDHTLEEQKKDIAEHYGGDAYAYVGDYYALVGDLYNRTHCNIVGHFDLVTKFGEKEKLFDTSDSRYISAAFGALEKLFGHGLCFEINYGAIARGYRTSPYPEKTILDKILSSGERVIYTSDCHDKSKLLLGIPEDAEDYM